MLQSNFTQVTTSFDMGTLKLFQFLQNKSSSPSPLPTRSTTGDILARNIK